MSENVPGKPAASRLGSSMLLVSGGILLSRVFGLLRDIVFAEYWGTGTAFAAFAIAFTIPNLLRALFGEGAFSAAFVPVFSERLETADREEAWDVARRVITVQALALLAAVLLVSLMSLAALPMIPESAPPRLALTLRLVPVVMPYALLICMTGAFSGVLNSMGHFAVPALTPVILNIVLIGATLAVCPAWDAAGISPVYALGAAVLLAGLLQLAAQMSACARCGLRLHPQVAWKDPYVRKVALLMAPALLGAGVTQLNVVVDRFLAGWLGSAAVGSLWYSQRLVYLPVGLFGVAMGVVCLPAMSRAWARQDRDAMGSSATFALRHVLFLAVPCAAMLSVAAVPVIQLLFQRGAFDERSVAETAWALAFYLPGIPAFCCAKVAVTPFYAQHDTRTPVKVALACMMVNLVLNLILMQVLRQGGLALATTISSYLNVSLLLMLTWRRTRAIQARRLSYAAVRIAVGAAAAAAAGRSVLQALPAPRHWPEPAGLLLRLAACGAAGVLVYLTVCLILRSREPAELLQALRRKKR